MAEIVMGQKTPEIDEPELSSDVTSAITRHAEPQSNSNSDDVDSESLFIPQDWTEVSLLEFINACLPEVDSLVGPRSQPICQVITSKERKLTWKEAQESDNLNGDEIFESVNSEEDGQSKKTYVRTKSDIRILYELRPDRLAGMTLGQFASEYRRLQPGGNGLQKAKDMIDHFTNLGPDTAHLVAGVANLMAPQYMKLKNEEIMVRRTGRKAVLQLLFSGKEGKYGAHLLWTPWRFLDEVNGDEEDEETKKRRLKIFPMSVYRDFPDDDTEQKFILTKLNIGICPVMIANKKSWEHRHISFQFYPWQREFVGCA